MWFFAILAAVAIAFVIQIKLYKKHSFDHLEYSVEMNADEVFEGDVIYMYECIVNRGRYPIPYIKIMTTLPEGMTYILTEKVKGKPKEKKTQSLQSVFTLMPGHEIKRRWRVSCDRRGEYSAGEVMALSMDLFALNTASKQLELANKGTSKVHLTVLPSISDLDEHYTSSMYLCGDVISNRCPVSDPLRICSSRDYTPSDPMNKVNWKMTATHGKLMVNIEEHTVRHSFGILLNMNSREIELHPEICSDVAAMELAVNTCASLLGSAAGSDVPIRMVMNTCPKIDGENCLEAVADDEIGEKIFVSRSFCGRDSTLDAMRILASVTPTITVTADKMFTHISQYAEMYDGIENYIVVSAYLDQYMLDFHTDMKKRGIDVIFYLTTSRVSTLEIPDNVEIYYRTY